MSRINVCGRTEYWGEVIPHWYLSRLTHTNERLVDEEFTLYNGETLEDGDYFLTYKGKNEPSYGIGLVPLFDYYLDNINGKKIDWYDVFEEVLTSDISSNYYLVKSLKEMEDQDKTNIEPIKINHLDIGSVLFTKIFELIKSEGEDKKAFLPISVSPIAGKKDGHPKGFSLEDYFKDSFQYYVKTQLSSHYSMRFPD
jgi:hypothetical protein